MILATVFLLSVIALLVAEWNESRVAIAISKLSASTTFVLSALSLGATESLYGQIMLAGLVLCWLGDAFLLSSGQSKGFELGIGSFLLGHLAYSAAFSQLGIDGTGLFASGLLMGGFALAASRRARPSEPSPVTSTTQRPSSSER